MTDLNSDNKWRESTFVPFEERKTILLLSDDIRLPSGVGVVSKDIVLSTIHHFNWVQVGGAIKHPEQGKVVDMRTEVSRLTSVDPNYMRIYPVSGWGNMDLIRYLLNNEKIDAIMHFTDPRFWDWLYQMEHEIRQTVPLLYYNIWDSVPFPMYNKNFYESCDALFAISKQTFNINRQVVGTDKIRIIRRDELSDEVDPKKENIFLSYNPHGVSQKDFKKLTIEDQGRTDMIKADGKEFPKTEYEQFLDFKESFNKEGDYDFILFYNSRNIRRKMPGDIIYAYKKFCDIIGQKRAEKCLLLMHTHIVDDNGTNLAAVVNDLAPNCNVKFSSEKIDVKIINFYYNLADASILISSNEGFGLSIAESLSAGTPVIANVTGGIQDQLGFVDENGKYLDPELHFNADWGSNHDGKYTDCGVWAIPVYPKTRSIVGSPPTPYISDDRCNWEDVVEAILQMYNLSPDERERRGCAGREYIQKVGMTTSNMGERFMHDINYVLNNWIPRKRFELLTTEIPEKKAVGLTMTRELNFEE